MQNPGKNIAAAAGCALLAALFILAAGSASHGKDKPVPRPRFYKPVVKEDLPDIYDDPRASVIAAVDTYCIVWFDFEQMTWQGWTAVDNTAQMDTFTRVEDFAGLGGGSYGRLVPIEGSKSLWFGARAGAGQSLCMWPSETAGYGNSWSQQIYAHVTPGIEYGDTATITVSYHLVCDTEEGHDVVTVCYDDHSGGCEILAEYSGIVDTIASHTFEFFTFYCFNLYFKFQSDQTISDEDGGIDTDGGAILDSITVYVETDFYSGVEYFEDFESYEPGEAPSGYWHWSPEYGYGSYSGLANNLVDRDPCNNNFDTQIIFYNGSAYPSPDYQEWGYFSTPFCTGSGGLNDPCQDEMVVSPVIDLRYFSSSCDENRDAAIPAGELDDLGGYILSYTVYLDNPVENLVFHTWKVRSIIDGCPQSWLSEPLVKYYGDDGLYYRLEHDISGMVESDYIQVAVGVVDMCSVWYGIYGDCADHTPAPWFDNVKVTRYATTGPQWAYQGADLFQDNFPSTDEMESFVRADMAADISPPSYPGIVPGDSVVVYCWAPNAGGLDTLGTGEARVYFHCNVYFLGSDGKPDLFGPQMEGNYGSYVSDDGDWTVLLCEPARTSSSAIAPDRYCIDLNDSLFTRGYMIEYYFKAYDLDGMSTTLPAGAETIPPYAYPSARSSNLFEFSCLPLSLNSGYGTLYVDDFDGRGTSQGLAQTYYDPSFDAYVVSEDDIPERYDVNQPSAMAGNSLGSRARQAHLEAAYYYMLWDSGDLSDGTIISAENGRDKSDDIALLISWLNTLVNYHPGLIIMGDNVATDLSRYSDGQIFMEDWFGTELVHSSFCEMTGGYEGGGFVNPLVTGIPGMSFEGLSFYLSGGCPQIADLDVLRPVGHGIKALDYPEYGDSSACAAVLATRTNSLGMDIYTEWMGFSFMRIRNAPNGALTRNHFLNYAFRHWLVGPAPGTDITESDIPAVTTLAGTYPNPFNPVTRVSFSLSKKGHVSLRIYDVTGRLVRILVDEIRDAGSYEAVWDGCNDGGRVAASGIYFCRMEAPDYERTLKMVLLR